MLSIIASITFVSVTANHLGLIKAAEELIEEELVIVNCPKCASFWSVLAYLLLSGQNIIYALATALLASYAAIWLELLEGYIDTLYNTLYEKIYPNTNDTLASDTK